jgi:Bifunctional DNA primase/polymerase, N-terminal
MTNELKPSIYDINAPLLRARGYRVHPIGPGTKEPQCWVPSLNQYQNMSAWNDPRCRPITSSQPDAGVGMVTGEQEDGAHIFGIDFDDDEISLRAAEIFPDTIEKFGNRGSTKFYRWPMEVKSRDFRVGSKLVQVLGAGKQTVVPPSVHMDTHKPYTFGGDWNLYTCGPADIPLAPTNYIELIEDLLRPYGYEREPEKPQFNGNDRAADEDNPFRQLNQRALDNLDKWVPELGLYKCHRQRGPHLSYAAVATWRPSTEGNPLEKRKCNLKITSKKGIKDFGTGEGFSSVDLVMRARNCERAEAFEWLSERLADKNGPNIDFDALIDNRSEPTGDPSGSKSPPGDELPPKLSEKKYRFKLINFWDMRPGLNERPYLIDELIPTEGLVVVWGPLPRLVPVA